MANLSWDVYWSLGITGLLGIIILRYSILLSDKIDIFTLLTEWVKKYFIAIISFLFLFSPFLFSYFLRQMFLKREPFRLVIDESSSYLVLLPTQPNNILIDKLLLVIATVASLLVANRLLDEMRNHKKKISVAKLLVISLQNQIENLSKIHFSLNDEGETNYNEYHKSISLYISEIRNDQLYKSSLEETGIFDLKDLESIAKHPGKINSYLIDLKQYIDQYKAALDYQYKTEFDRETLMQLTPNTVFLERQSSFNLSRREYLKRRVHALELYADLQILILCKKIVRDEQLFEESKTRISDQYGHIRNQLEFLKTGSDLNPWLKDTERWFKFLGLYNELESSYQRQKPEFE